MASLTLPTANAQDRTPATAFVNVTIIVGTDEEGQPVAVQLPVGIPLNADGKYGGKTRINGMQQQLIERLIAGATASEDGVLTLEVPTKLEVRLLDAPKKEVAKINFSF